MSNSNAHLPAQFSRIERLLGRDKLEKLFSSSVTIVGLGAVGGYVTEALARAGIGKLKLFDHDKISESNINRQILALHDTVELPKSDLAEQRVRQINPLCQVESHAVFANKDTIDQVLSPKPDLLIDAIDSLSPKVHLLAEAIRREIPIISSMGAALRTDPTKIKVDKLNRTSVCPLARLVRKRLKRQGVPLNLHCVYSVETSEGLEDTAIGLESECEDDQVFGRPRKPLGSLPTITGIFGLTIANEAIKMLTAE